MNLIYVNSSNQYFQINADITIARYQKVKYQI